MPNAPSTKARGWQLHFKRMAFEYDTRRHEPPCVIASHVSSLSTVFRANYSMLMLIMVQRQDQNITSQSEIKVQDGMNAVFPRLWRYCIALTGQRDWADDLAQTTCLRAIEQGTKFEA